jgi:hypothetical protein
MMLASLIILRMPKKVPKRCRGRIGHLHICAKSVADYYILCKDCKLLTLLRR